MGEARRLNRVPCAASVTLKKKYVFAGECIVLVVDGLQMVCSRRESERSFYVAFDERSC